MFLKNVLKVIMGVTPKKVENNFRPYQVLDCDCI